MLHRLMRLMVANDRHREVINQRISDVLSTNVLQNYDSDSTIIQQIVQDPSINLNELLADTKFKNISLPQDVATMFMLLNENEPWLQWTSLKAENCAAFEYNTLFEQFKKELDQWMTWHSNCTSSSIPFTESIQRGTEFEKLGESIIILQSQYAKPPPIPK